MFTHARDMRDDESESKVVEESTPASETGRRGSLTIGGGRATQQVHEVGVVGGAGRDDAHEAGSLSC
jgi:hypothetical protein